MREYDFHATEASVEALRRLMAPWASMAATDRTVAITTSDGVVVLLSVERAEVEMLEASRLRADVVTTDDVHLADARELPVGDLGLGRNDVVVFSGECWTEQAPDTGDGRAAQVMQLTGRAGQRPPSAVVVCTTTDSVVVAASSGEGVLVQIGVRPMTLDVARDRVTIARFLMSRGYANDEDPR